MKKYLKLKKLAIALLMMSVSVDVLYGCTSIRGNINTINEENLFESSTNVEDKNRILNYDDVKDSLIRFHVIANSDNEDDQKLKLKVKDKVIDYLYPYLNSSESLEQSRGIIKDKMQEVKKIAEEIIRDNNYGYSVKVELSRENFPDKSYGNITLPQGNYEAFRIIIGNGQGKNWWCVMFPPLCFVDESKAQVEYDKTEEKIKSKENRIGLNEEVNLNKNEIDDQEETDIKDKNDIQIKFKIIELIKEIFN